MYVLQMYVMHVLYQFAEHLLLFSQNHFMSSSVTLSRMC